MVNLWSILKLREERFVVTKTLINLLAAILGRRLSWRIGRSLYMHARREAGSNMQLDGEHLLQRQIFHQFANSSQKLVLFDVGANIGDWTHYALERAAEHGMSGRLNIHAFEPVPSTFRALEDRINDHPLCDSVRLVTSALSSQEGSAEMFIVRENAGTNSLHLDPNRNDLQQIQVETTTIDAYCQQEGIPVIHFLKCDTEGHDMEVILGAQALIEKQNIMVFQFEYNHIWIASRHYLKDAFDFVAELPYDVGRVTPSGIEIYKEWHPELERFFEGNYVLIAASALGWFDVQVGHFDESNTYSA